MTEKENFDPTPFLPENASEDNSQANEQMESSKACIELAKKLCDTFCNQNVLTNSAFIRASQQLKLSNKLSTPARSALLMSSGINSNFGLLAQTTQQLAQAYREQMLPTEVINQLQRQYEQIRPAFIAIEKSNAFAQYLTINQELLRHAESLAPVFAQIAKPFEQIQKLIEPYQEIASLWTKHLAPINPDSEVFYIFQKIEEIDLDLSPYDDVTLKDIISVLRGQKPCDYKEILQKNFGKTDKECSNITVRTNEQVLDVKRLIFTIFFDMISWWMNISYFCPSLTPQEMKKLWETEALPYFEQQIKECCQRNAIDKPVGIPFVNKDTGKKNTVIAAPTICKISPTFDDLSVIHPTKELAKLAEDCCNGEEVAK